MKIIIVDDRPYFMWATIERLKEMGVDEIVMLYFHGILTYFPDRDSEIAQKCEKLDVELFHIDQNTELMERLDEYCAEADTFIFMDFGLGDTDIFEDRIDVIYAKTKMQPEGFPIWFYTGMGEQVIDRLNRTFDNHTIPVEEFIPQRAIMELDYDYIRRQVLHIQE